MAAELKIALIVLFAGFTIIRVHYRRLTAAPRKNASGNGLDTLLIGALIPYEVITLFAYLLSADRFPEFGLPLPAWLRWLGALLGLTGLLCLAWAHHNLGSNFSVPLYIQAEHKLVTDGPYRWVRHPIYTAFCMIHLATFLLTANWFIGITWLTGLTLVIATRVRREERMLADRFGQEYLAYAQATGRFLPRIRVSSAANKIARRPSGRRSHLAGRPEDRV